MLGRNLYPPAPARGYIRYIPHWGDFSGAVGRLQATFAVYRAHNQRIWGFVMQGERVDDGQAGIEQVGGQARPFDKLRAAPGAVWHPRHSRAAQEDQAVFPQFHGFGAMDVIKEFAFGSSMPPIIKNTRRDGLRVSLKRKIENRPSPLFDRWGTVLFLKNSFT